MAREFSVESFRMEIFRVFEGLAISCLTTNCKYIEDRPEKDGVFTVEKRRLILKKRRVSSVETSFFESKDFVFLERNADFLEEERLLRYRKQHFGRQTPRNTKETPQPTRLYFLTSQLRKQEHKHTNSPIWRYSTRSKPVADLHTLK